MAVFSGAVSAVTVSSASVVYVNGDGGDDNWDGLSATYNVTTKSGPKATISNATGIVDNGGTVRIANGVYTGDSNGNLYISKNMTIIGQSTANTIINTHFVDNLQSGFSLKIFNITIKNAESSAGGAIANSGDLTLEKVSFIRNSAATNGGAIINYGNLVVNNCLFSNNLCNSNGGAIANMANANLTVNNTIFEFNNGSAILNNGTANFYRCNFSKMGNGGAAYNYGLMGVHFSSIIDNEYYAPTFTNDRTYLPEATLDASYNWWGSNDPSFFTVGTIFDNWIIATLNSSTSIIPKNGHTLIKFDMMHDCYRNAVTGYIPDGIAVTFTTTLGNITSIAYTVNGTATATLTAGTVGGLTSIVGNLDKEYRATTVTIDVTAPTAASNIKSGTYNVNKVITLSKTKAGTIYYTLTGATPTTSSTKYVGPITISSSKVLKFIAIDTAGNKSPVYTYNYTIDKTAPKISLTTPTNLKTGIKRTSNIVIKFSENINYSTYYNKITIKNSSGKSLSLSKSINGNTLTIKTSSKSANTWYTVTIPKSAVKDKAGNNLTANYSFKFRTGS